MGKMVVIQSILLSIVVILLASFLGGNFVYITSLIVGLIPFIYLKKHSKKEVLKTNLWSSLVALIVVLIVFSILYFWFGAMFGMEDSISASGLPNVLAIFDAGIILRYGLIFLALFNVPVLIYYFFGKKDTQNVHVPAQVPATQVPQ